MRPLWMLFLLLVGGLVLSQGGPSAEESGPSPRPEVPLRSGPHRVEVPVQGPADTGRSAATQARILLPDGSFLPTLNGVEQRITWTRPRASPVLRVERDPHTGVDWYVHRDGSRSTTVMVARSSSQGGREMQAVLIFARPDSERRLARLRGPAAEKR